MPVPGEFRWRAQPVVFTAHSSRRTRARVGRISHRVRHFRKGGGGARTVKCEQKFVVVIVVSNSPSSRRVFRSPCFFCPFDPNDSRTPGNRSSQETPCRRSWTFRADHDGDQTVLRRGLGGATGAADGVRLPGRHYYPGPRAGRRREPRLQSSYRDRGPTANGHVPATTAATVAADVAEPVARGGPP